MNIFQYNKGADSNWYKRFGDQKKPVIPLYLKYFRQRDTLLNIPKMLEPVIEAKDKEVYNQAVAEAEERVTNSKMNEAKVNILPVYNKDYIDPVEPEDESSEG
jgi:hypothetical protein